MRRRGQYMALDGTGMCKRKVMERHGKTRKDHQRQQHGKIARASALHQPLPFHSYSHTHTHTQDTQADVCISWNAVNKFWKYNTITWYIGSLYAVWMCGFACATKHNAHMSAYLCDKLQLNAFITFLCISFLTWIWSSLTHIQVIPKPQSMLTYNRRLRSLT